ncbi:MAG: universal stress protein [Syntrophobacteraceae bacterium]|jgi:nucleotide-binding universal stress UspA family protein
MKILVPVDGSAHSLKALEIAADFARTKQADIYVISVASSIGGMEDHEISPHRRERHEEVIQQRADEAITSAREVLGKQEVDVRIAQTVSTSLSVADAIIDFAQAEQIDLIVLGSRGLSVSSGFKVGSIARQVVKYCPCSVYLVKIAASAQA